MLRKFRDELDIGYRQICRMDRFRVTVKLLLVPVTLWRRMWRRRRGGLFLEKLDLVVTTRCTLRCRHCSNMIPYHSLPKDFSADQLCRDMEKMLSLVRRVDRVFPIGGEPLLHPELPRILEFLCASKKINHVELITNGSILPDAALIPYLQHPKVLVSVSNYYPLVHSTNQVLEILRQNDIAFRLLSYSWHENHFSRMPFGDSELELTRRRAQCCPAGCHQLFDGRLYLCPISANVEYLNLIPELPREGVLIREPEARNSKRQQLDAVWRLLFQAPYLQMCDHCRGWEEHSAVIPAAEQVVSSPQRGGN